jgi:hypothetical protein
MRSRLVFIDGDSAGGGDKASNAAIQSFAKTQRKFVDRVAYAGTSELPVQGDMLFSFRM